jgi:hypothetical protein
MVTFIGNQDVQRPIVDLLNNNAEIPSSDFIHFENDFQMFVWKEKW